MSPKFGVMKWEKSNPCRPVHNVISSDFPKYVPQPWKFMDGPARIEYLLSHEYQRMWIKERELWMKRMYPDKAIVIDFVKQYVQSFKTVNEHPKPEKKKPFTMKKFQNAKSKTNTRRPPGDKAMRPSSENKTNEKKTEGTE